MASRKRSLSNDADVSAMYKEWDEALCPICMDHPHNAVLLICSAHGKGCRSYICDTSYRHSNCLDRYKKLKEENTYALTAPHLIPGSHDGFAETSTNLDLDTSVGIVGDHTDHVVGNVSTGVNTNLGSGEQGRTIWEALNLDEADIEKSEEGLDLRCPLCRGSVLGWKVVEDARKHLNLKSRSCSHEACSFSGNYRELRGHARRVHPTIRPADVDPNRQRAWRRLEDQREYNDIVSAIRSAMPGAVILGDYVMENGDRDRDRLSAENGRGGGTGENGRLWNALLFFQMFDSIDRRAGQRGGGRPRVLPRHRRATRTFPRHRYLWGENLLGLRDDDEEEERDEAGRNVRADDMEPNARRRRRLTRDRSSEDQQ